MAPEDSNEAANNLFAQIVKAARDHDYKALLDIDGNANTSVLLEELPKEQSRQAAVQLRDARLWKARRNEKAKGKLDAAETAIDGLDLPLARGILRKLDPSVLADSEVVRYDALLLEVEARAMEIEDIELQIPPPPPSPGDDRRRGPFWRR